MVDIVTGRVMAGGTPAGIASREHDDYDPECKVRKAGKAEIDAMLHGMGITDEPRGKLKRSGLTSYKRLNKEGAEEMATAKRGRPRKEKPTDISEQIKRDEERVKELERQMEKEKAEPEEAPKQATKLTTKPEAETITNVVPSYPQDEEGDEYRYFDWAWWNDIARGLTAGAKKHPGETWHDIPAKEHVARIVRHGVKYLMGDESEDHLIHIAMRAMMAYRMDKIEHES